MSRAASDTGDSVGWRGRSVRSVALPFLLGALPLGLWGFFASAAANRPLFALWGVLAVAAWTLALRTGWVRDWSPLRRAAALCVTGAVCAAALALLLAAWADDLALGLAAVAPALPAGPLSSPPGAFGLAVGLSAVAAVSLLLAHRSEEAAV